MPADRSGYPVRKLALAAEGADEDVRAMSPERRVEMVWELTVQAWEFSGRSIGEPRLGRHVVRVVRGGRDVPFVGRVDLIANKRAAGRAKDLADVALLEEE